MPELHKPCLILDHDDTVVDSTAHLHYPAHLIAMEQLRPERPPITLEEYFAVNCDPGIFSYYLDVVGLSEAELRQEYDIWLGYTRTHVPQVYPGMRRVIETQRALGGTVCVVTHSEPETVLRDYEANGLPAPDLIFGGSVPEEQRKPSPYPVLQIMERMHAKPEDVMVVDDLVPGYRMAQRAGVGFAAACWAHHIPQAEGLFRSEGACCCASPEELWQILFGDDQP